MRRRPDAARWGVLLTLTLVAGCAQATSSPKAVTVGHHRVRLVEPTGWEHLDHGREQLFREREAELEISLSDLGPASRAGLAHEIEAARAVWLAGRRKDALARVRELHGPPLAFASPEARATFWDPWTQLASLGEGADSAAVGRAFRSLIEGTQSLAPDSLERMADYVIQTTEGLPNREIASQERRILRGATWVVVDTWNRISHQDRRRIACRESGGYLLAVRMKRGSVERAGLVFEALLQSIEPEPDGARAL